MKKQFLLMGAVIVAGSLTLVGFKAKTLAEQKAEITAAVAAQIDDFKAAKTAECDERVMAEAQRMMEDYRVTQETAVTPKAGIAKPAPAKKPAKPTAKGPKVDPLPQPTAPTNPQTQRGGAVKEGDVQQQTQRGGAVKEGDVQQQTKRGGATKVDGGGK
jgi:hypothetical protein